MSESQRELPEVDPAEEPPEFMAPLPLEFEPPTVEPPTLLPDVPPALPALLPALPPAPPPDCAIAVIAKRAAAVAVTKSFNFIVVVLL